jgi:outer membrane protein TolC
VRLAGVGASGGRVRPVADAHSENGIRGRDQTGRRKEPDDRARGDDDSAGGNAAAAVEGRHPAAGTSSIQNSTLDSARGFSGGTTQPQNQFSITASASMPILNASRWAQVAQSRDQVDVTVAAAAETRQQMLTAAAQSYLAVIRRAAAG